MNIWTLTEMTAQLLAADERDAVMGDLIEAGESAWHGFMEVSGLIVRRQIALWRSWRPWLAALGLAVPASFALMGISVALSRTFVSHFAWKDVLPGVVLCEFFLLLVCAWSGGFVLHAISRRTFWLSALVCFMPCLFCLARFRIESLSRFSLLLFLLPAIAGVLCSRRYAMIGRMWSVALALSATLCMVMLSSMTPIWILNWALLWPAWFLALRPQHIQTTFS